MKDSNILFGIIAFLILTVMAVTSNNTAVRILGRNWKRLHYLIYIVLILVIIHSINIGLVFMKNIVVEIIILLLALLLILGNLVSKIYK